MRFPHPRKRSSFRVWAGQRSELVSPCDDRPFVGTGEFCKKSSLVGAFSSSVSQRLDLIFFRKHHSEDNFRVTPTSLSEFCANFVNTQVRTGLLPSSSLEKFELWSVEGIFGCTREPRSCSNFSVNLVFTVIMIMNILSKFLQIRNKQNTVKII